jgi:hypothetical protein
MSPTTARELLLKTYHTLHWLPAFGWQQVLHRLSPVRAGHVVIALADHFEPARITGLRGKSAPVDEQERRLERWCRIYPTVFDGWRDADGYPFRHTYFYPAEQYAEAPMDRLVEHCRGGWGEVEIHLHHGVGSPDSAGNTRRALIEFRDMLAGRGCLSRWNGEGEPRYGFVHGNWALANSAGGRFCGVDEEMSILAETGCYADFTLPSAPDRSQVAKINALYECGLPLDHPAPHRRGRDLRRGSAPKIFPLIMQGPLGLGLSRRTRGLPRPKIENGDLTTNHPPTMARLALWRRAGITVRGQPDWLFIKLHCHGMKPEDEAAMLGPLAQEFLRELAEWGQSSGTRLHYVTAREMVNIALAACDGREGSPGSYRDYRLIPIA